MKTYLFRKTDRTSKMVGNKKFTTIKTKTFLLSHWSGPGLALSKPSSLKGLI